ncbi:hypothetical protein [Blastopirellula marina]|uniref:hypothetical protein n=1 Tax=Blastopirellula marina TaxID=124 RepID=UPI00103FDEE9|nr:hypothetical protein [Blastopirellula marina]
MIAPAEKPPSGGPGTQFKAIAPPQFFDCMSCENYLGQMDAWGSSGCEERFEEITTYWTERGKMFDCTRRSRLIQTAECLACHGRTQIKVLSCPHYGSCTITQKSSVWRLADYVRTDNP